MSTKIISLDKKTNKIIIKLYNFYHNVLLFKHAIFIKQNIKIFKIIIIIL